MGAYEVKSIRQGNVVYIYIVWENGCVEEVGHILLGWDGQWKEDAVFIEEIIAAYKKRLRKLI